MSEGVVLDAAALHALGWRGWTWSEKHVGEAEKMEFLWPTDRGVCITMVGDSDSCPYVAGFAATRVVPLCEISFWQPERE